MHGKQMQFTACATVCIQILIRLDSTNLKQDPIELESSDEAAEEADAQTLTMVAAERAFVHQAPTVVPFRNYYRFRVWLLRIRTMFSR